MSTTSTTNEFEKASQRMPGAQLASMRAVKGYSVEYVASKLHLRVCIIELLEKDDYQNMPEAVFVKGYLRAYARLLELPSEPLLELFNQYGVFEKKTEKALWQSKRETHHAEHIVRWITGIFALGVLIAVVVWWQSNKDNERSFPKQTVQQTAAAADKTQPESEIRLTDLSKMRSLLSSSLSNAKTEEAGG